MIRRWHIVISGYSQNYATPTGCEKLWLAMDPLNAPGVRLLYFPWNSPWCDIAEWIKRCSAPPAAAEVLCYAYSWGAGHGFVTLARELDQRGLGVRHAVLADPVWRRPGWPTGLQWVGTLESVFGSKTIPIPTNVAEVTWCYQRNDKPDGDRPVRVKGGDTRINPGVKLRECVHATIDDSDWFQLTSLAVAQQQPPPTTSQP
jgi:hypothetical protein